MVVFLKEAPAGTAPAVETNEGSDEPVTASVVAFGDSKVVMPIMEALVV